MNQLIIAVLLTAIVLLRPLPGALEETEFSLLQCVTYAEAHSRTLKAASLQQNVSQKKVSETIGSTLPQINVSGSLNDNEIIATQVMPGELVGQPGTFIPVKMGTRYDASASLQLTQTVVDPVLLADLKSARLGARLAQQSKQKTGEDLVYSISMLYYQTLITSKRITILKANLESNEKTLASCELRFRNGVATASEVDKVRLTRNNTLSQLQQTELSLEQSLNQMKYLLGMPIEQPLRLSESAMASAGEATALVPESGPVNQNRIDFRQLQTELQMEKTSRRRAVADFLPSLTFYAKYGYSAYRESFDFFRAGPDWYTNAAIGLSLSVPVFDGFRKKSRLDQASLNIAIAEQNLKQKEQAIALEVSNAGVQYRNALDNIRSEKENWTLAEKVYADSLLGYHQGTESLLGLTQVETALKEAQNSYISRLLDLYCARIDLEHAQGTLTGYIRETGD
jgi:outer membrane protein TolC